MTPPEKEPFVPEEAMELVGVELPRVSEDTWIEMARCFIEEYVRMGYGKEKILEICRNPFYQGMHDILRKKGEGFVRALIEEAMQQWRPPQSDGGQGPSRQQEGSDAESL